MKTYHSKKPANKKGIIATVASLAVVIIALAIALPLLLRNRSSVDPVPDVPATTDPVVYVSPLEQESLGKEFSVEELQYSKTLKNWRTHRGVDFMAEVGNNVRAIYDGKVENVSSTNLDGYTVTISHADGLVSVYKSLGEDIKVEVGDTVKAGDVIGTVGATMLTEEADGPHLHLEMTLNGNYVNPLDYISSGAEK